MISSCCDANPGELDASVGQWWTDFIEGDIGARESTALARRSKGPGTKETTAAQQQRQKPQAG